VQIASRWWVPRGGQLQAKKQAKGNGIRASPLREQIFRCFRAPDQMKSPSGEGNNAQVVGVLENCVRGVSGVTSSIDLI